MGFNLEEYVFSLYRKAERYKIQMLEANSYPQTLKYKAVLNCILEEIETLNEELKKEGQDAENCNAGGRRDFTVDELAKYNGSNGSPAYAAVNGTVYDVTNVAAWGGGTHFGMFAGKDLSREFPSCHSQDVLKSVPVVGKLV